MRLVTAKKGEKEKRNKNKKNQEEEEEEEGWLESAEIPQNLTIQE